MFKFGEKEVYKDFYKQRQITDIFTISVNKVVVSDKVSCNNGKDRQYTVSYHVDGEIIKPLFIKMPGKYLAMVYHNMARTLPMQCGSMFLKH